MAVWRPGVSLLPGLNYVNARTPARSDQSWDSGVPGVRGPETGSRGRARAVGVGARAVGGAGNASRHFVPPYYLVLYCINVFMILIFIRNSLNFHSIINLSRL